jgi:hypothetical protein
VSFTSPDANALKGGLKIDGGLGVTFYVFLARVAYILTKIAL